MHPYLSTAYAAAFDAPYKPLILPYSGVATLARPIGDTKLSDVMGCYPLFPIMEQDKLAEDLENLQGYVSFTCVTDVFFHASEEALKTTFDHVAAFKPHYVYRADGNEPAYNKHHRYEIKRAQKQVETRVIALKDYLDDWFTLYQELVSRHAIGGIQNFFAALARMEELTMVGAFLKDALVSAHLFFAYGDYAYSHLAASSEAGYKAAAAYAVNDAALRHYLAKGIKALDFGAGAGVSEASKGLAKFKQGFANTELSNFVCGKILDKVAYQKLSAEKNTKFFPAYRG